MIQSRLRCSSKIRKAIAVHPFDADGVYPQSAGPSTALSGGLLPRSPRIWARTIIHGPAKRPFLLSTPTVYPRCTSRYTPRAPEREGENCRPEHGVLGGLLPRSPWATQATCSHPRPQRFSPFLFFRALNFFRVYFDDAVVECACYHFQTTPKVPKVQAKKEHFYTRPTYMASNKPTSPASLPPPSLDIETRAKDHDDEPDEPMSRPLITPTPLLRRRSERLMRTKVKAAVAEVAALAAESVPLKETGHSVPSSRRSTIHEKDANLSGPICMK